MIHLSKNTWGLPCLLPILALLALVTIGCSGSTGARLPVSGAVSLDGNPLSGGWIHFRPISEGPSSAAEIHAGKFAIAATNGLVPGTYRVEIEFQKPTGKTIRVNTGEQIEEIEETRQIIPPQYNRQSVLTAEIQAQGENALTFELKSKMQ